MHVRHRSQAAGAALRWFTLLAAASSLFALAGACGVGPATGADENDAAADGSVSSSSPDRGDTSETEAPKDAATSSGDAALPTCSAPSGLGRGLTWVRANPMMISGLSVRMGAPSPAAVTEYFDAFHATAVHLWEDGLPTEIAGFAATNHAGFRYISWVHKNGTSLANGQVLGGAPPLPGRIGYQIGDEPENATTLSEMLAGAAVVKKADPTALRIINLSDTEAAQALRTQAAQAEDIDVLSYDRYHWGTSANDSLMRTRTAALAVAKPYWRYIRSFHFKTEAPRGTAADLRWDALIGAVYGYTGHSWFLYTIEANSNEANTPGLAPELFVVGGSYAAAKTALYQAAAASNQELAHIGRTLVLLQSTDVRYVAAIPLLRPAGVKAWTKGAGNDPYLSGVGLGGNRDLLVGHFRDDCGETYVMVQNQAHPGGTVPNNSSDAAGFTLQFDFAGAVDPTLDKSAVLSLDTTTGTVAPRVLTPTGARTAKLDLELAAGAVFFFKYKNARPFVRQ